MPIIIEGQKSIYSDRVITLGTLILDPSSASPPSMTESFADVAVDKAKDRLKDAAVGRATKEVAKILGPLGFLAGFAADAVGNKIKEGKDNEASLKGIEEFAKQQIPGMVFKEAYIAGEKYRIGVDASSQIDLPTAEPRVIVERMDDQTFHHDVGGSYHNQILDLKEPQLAAQIDAMKNAASAGIEAFKQVVAESLPADKKKYREDMAKYLDQIDRTDADRLSLLTPPPNPLGADTRYDALLDETIQKTNHKYIQIDMEKSAPASAQAQRKEEPAPSIH